MSDHLEVNESSIVDDTAIAKQRARCTVARRFSTVVSTEDHFKCPKEAKIFYGAYGHARKSLDYSYHSHYQKERIWLHDSIIEDFLEGPGSECHSTPLTPWIVFTVGAPGAGKLYTIEHLVKSGRLRLLPCVRVDTNEIRHCLPEYMSYVRKAPMLVAPLTQKECGYIAETLVLAALPGRNVIFDSSMQDGKWFVKFIRRLRSDYPRLKVAMIHVTASTETIVKRAHDRSSETQMEITDEDIAEALETIPQSLELVKPEADFFCTIRNENEPDLVDNDWQSFTSTMYQDTCAISLDKSGGTPAEKKVDPCCSILRRRPMSRRRFSVLQSSEDNHGSDDLKFYGSFRHIRETLDYNYHKNYTFERQKFQDAIIHEFLKAAVLTDKNGEVCTTPTEPWTVFTAGAMGAGKSYTMKRLVSKGRFPLLAFVNVDPDEIRQYLPEFHLYVEQNPELAGALTNKECGYIAEILTLAGLQAGKNVLVDGSLRDSDWYKIYFARLRKEFPALRLAILHVTAPRDAVFKRAAARAEVTGRVVPQALLIESMEQVPRSVKQLGPLVDYVAELNNAPGAPDIELVTPGQSWPSFQSQWIQTCAWIPKHLRKKKMQSEAQQALVAGG